MFIGEKGGLLRRSNWHTTWEKARTQVGLPGFRLHDLRHTCNTLTAATGASTRELMHRALKARRYRPIFLVDLTLPRNV